MFFSLEENVPNVDFHFDLQGKLWLKKTLNRQPQNQINVRGILQAKILEWVVILLSKGSS